MSAFNVNLRDSQATQVRPIAPEGFDYAKYEAYEQEQLAKCSAFTAADEGLLVYRRFRADGVFFDKCRSMEDSLRLQLGALNQSMLYKADIPNFLEPWYGIGYIATCFGADYLWQGEQAPYVKPLFEDAQSIIDADPLPIERTPVGRRNLEMIEYFLEKTHGRLPVSFSDVQSPLNMLSYLLPIDDLFMQLVEEPDVIREAASILTDLLIDYLKKQAQLIGNCLCKPGHGFASSRAFRGVGMSDDLSIMLSGKDYLSVFAPLDARVGAAFDGMAYHSCGNWANKIDMVRQLDGLRTVDGAFSPQTDPIPNDPAAFATAFAGKDVVVNARAVGGPEEATGAFAHFLVPGQKLIAVSYCQTPEEQAKLYDDLHARWNARA